MFTYFLAETLKVKSVREIEQMDSKEFENWRTYFSVKSAHEKRIVEKEREKAELERKMKSAPKGTMMWHWDN